MVTAQEGAAEGFPIGLPLTKDEVREVTNMASRVATIVLLQPSLNTNYRICISIACQ